MGRGGELVRVNISIMFVQTALAIRALSAARDYKHSHPGDASAAATTSRRREEGCTTSTISSITASSSAPSSAPSSYLLITPVGAERLHLHGQRLCHHLVISLPITHIISPITSRTSVLL